MLFDKNGIYYMPIKKDLDYDFAIDIMGEKDSASNLFDLETALQKGNLFKDLYKPYKSYTPRTIKVNTAREKCLLEIQELDFSIGDLNLYLDLYPDDLEAFTLFSKLTREYLKKTAEYASTFGPLTLDQTGSEYEWSKGVWPWEEGGM